MIKINWEKVADPIAVTIRDSKEFNDFIDYYVNDFEDNLRSAIREKFIDPLERQFKPDDDSVMEFVLTLEGDLIRAFFKRFVTEYIGGKF